MKFFNWVHKRFNHHHPIDKDEEFGQKVDKAGDSSVIGTKGSRYEEVVGDKETQALLRKVVLVDALDGWKDGILAIGTFGFDPLKPFNPGYKDYLVLESHEETPVLTPEFSQEDSDNDSDNDEDSDIDSDEDESVSVQDEEANPLMYSSLGYSFNDEDIAILSSDHQVCDESKKKVGRTTLADLFLADAHQLKMLNLDSGKALDHDGADNKKQVNVRTKKTLSFAKKLIPKVKDETSPIKNIQRLMRRMMKRKIHPELIDVKSQKFEGQMAAATIELVRNGAEKSASDSVSLLAMCPEL